MSTEAFREKQTEIVAVSEFLTSTMGKGLRLPLEWKSFAACIRHELQKLGWFDLANDVRVENDGITLRWTVLSAKQCPEGGLTFVLGLTLAQKAAEERT